MRLLMWKTMERDKREDPTVELAALKAERSIESVYRDNKDLIERIHEVSIENLHLRSVIEMFLSDNYTDFFEHFEECCKQAKIAIGKP